MAVSIKLCLVESAISFIYIIVFWCLTSYLFCLRDAATRVNMVRARMERQKWKILDCGFRKSWRQYDGTRHNTGFMVLDAFAQAAGVSFDDRRYGFVPNVA